MEMEITAWQTPVHDFHIALLWIRSLEIATSHPPQVSQLDFDLEIHNLFATYRSPWRA